MFLLVLDSVSEQCFNSEATIAPTTAELYSDVTLASGTSSDPGHVSEASSEAVAGGALSDAALGNSLPETTRPDGAPASVKVEDDGSVFIQADESYLRDRDKILSLIGDKSNLEPHRTQLQVSNDLLYSLD